MRITPQPSRSQKGTIWGWYLPPVYGILWYCINSLTGDGLWFSIIMFIHKFMLKLLGIDLTHPHVCFLTRGNRMKQAPKPGFFWPWTKTGRCPTGIQTHKCGHQLWLGFNWAFCTMPGEGCMMIIYISQTAWSTWLLERILTRAWNRWLSQVVFRPWHVAICFTRAWNEWPCQAVFRPWNSTSSLTRVRNEWTCQAVFRPWHLAICSTRAWKELFCQAVFSPWHLETILTRAWNDWPCQAVLKVLDIGQSWWGALDLLEKKHLVKEDYF